MEHQRGRLKHPRKSKKIDYELFTKNHTLKRQTMSGLVMQPIYCRLWTNNTLLPVSLLLNDKIHQYTKDCEATILQ